VSEKIIVRCDRCNRLIKVDQLAMPSDHVRIEIVAGVAVKRPDLCKPCKGSLEMWFREVEHGQEYWSELFPDDD